MCRPPSPCCTLRYMRLARTLGGSSIPTPSIPSAAAVAGREIPPIVDEMVVVLGGAVRVSEYAPPASVEVAEKVCSALGERAAVLMRNHGAVAVGANPVSALEMAMLVERAAKIFVLSSVLGGAAALPDEVLEAETAIYEMRRQSRLRQNALDS